MFTKLNQTQINTKLDYIKNYVNTANAADGSIFDPNANVSCKNIATLEAEINKDINIQINRGLVSNRIKEMFGEDLAKEYCRQIEEHEIYVHDETSLKPYCMSISMYPFLLQGLLSLGGESKAPKHLESFCGSFINLVFSISSQIAGAIATVEFLLYFDYFARKDFGYDYLESVPDLVSDKFQHVVYSINQPAAARGYQSVFWNISVYDENYFNSMFGESFTFPDGSRPDWNSLKELQKFFMKWFNNERTKSVLTFPIVTAAILVDDTEPKDKEFADFLATEMEEGNSFFIYMSDSVDSLSSCCRLRNAITDNSFSYSLGAGGVSTGSINVITLNMNRIEQKALNLKEIVSKVHKYQVAYRSLIQDYIDHGMLPVYSAGFISLDKQYLTLGVNGLVEAAESINLKPGDNEFYKHYIKKTLKTIFDLNKEASKQYGCMFNTEFVPAENLGVKNAKWDKKDKLIVPRGCYNSYLYPVEDKELNVIDKFKLHGKEITQYLDGGSALHLNLDDSLTKEQYLQLFKVAAVTGCNYWCVNVKNTVCNDCGFIDKDTNTVCSQCKSENVDHATRIIGYLKRISSFSNPRQVEEKARKYH